MNLDSTVFYSHNIEKVTNFYTNIIGLKMDYQREGKFVSFVFPNNTKLSIKKAVEKREVPGHQTIFISTKNAHKLYKEMRAKKVNILKKLTDEPWALEFSVLDPDQNKIQFMQRKK